MGQNGTRQDCAPLEPDWCPIRRFLTRQCRFRAGYWSSHVSYWDPPVAAREVAQIQSRPANAPEWYNYSGMYPAKYQIPTEMKERMVTKAAIRRAAAEVGDPAVPRPDPIDEMDVQYVKMMKAQ